MTGPPRKKTMSNNFPFIAFLTVINKFHHYFVPKQHCICNNVMVLRCRLLQIGIVFPIWHWRSVCRRRKGEKFMQRRTYPNMMTYRSVANKLLGFGGVAETHPSHHLRYHFACTINGVVKHWQKVDPASPTAWRGSGWRDLTRKYMPKHCKSTKKLLLLVFPPFCTSLCHACRLLLFAFFLIPTNSWAEIDWSELILMEWHM